MKIKNARNLVSGLAAMVLAAMVLTALVVHAQSYHCAQGVNHITNAGCVAEYTLTNGVCASAICRSMYVLDNDMGYGDWMAYTKCDVTTGFGKNDDVTKYTYHDWIYIGYRADATCPAPCCGCPLLDGYPQPVDMTWCDSQFNPLCAYGE